VHEDASPEAVLVEAVDVEDLLRKWEALNWELSDHEGLKGVAYRREIREPGYVALRCLLENAIEVDHVASHRVQCL